jgi:hypothetical protein
MSRTNPKMRDFANRLIAIETGENESSETGTPAAVHVAEKLRRHLSTLMGNAGFRGLLSRALALAGAEVRWLRSVEVKADGSLAGLEEHAQLKPDEFLEGSIALLDELLGLLVAFIGEDMTLRLVRDVWPGVPLDDRDGGRR